ncbi:MAG: SemiSWEET transporter [Hyphomicrobiales bacterium]|nr:SemiSWEET transporter [Hyphomicrobiales bacterium]
METWIGGVAAALTTGAFLPQAIRIIRTRETAGISLAMYAVFTAGVVLWLVYGVLIGDIPIIAANLLTLVQSAAILALKLRYG